MTNEREISCIVDTAIQFLLKSHIKLYGQISVMEEEVGGGGSGATFRAGTW